MNMKSVEDVFIHLLSYLIPTAQKNSLPER